MFLQNRNIYVCNVCNVCNVCIRIAILSGDFQKSEKQLNMLLKKSLSRSTAETRPQQDMGTHGQPPMKK